MQWLDLKQSYNYLRICSLSFVVILFMACATTQKQKKTNQELYINVNTVGIIGDGKTDNRIAIETALNKGGNYYFPKGIYLISSYTYVYNIIRIADNTTGLKLVFEDGASLKAANNLISDKDKGCLLCFISAKADIPFIKIENLQIDGNKTHQKGMINGVMFYEQPNFFIREVSINKAYIHHTTGGGLHSEALYTNLKNIRTEYCGSHGIGLNQSYNQGTIHTTEIDGHFSMNDEAYSIDFSAPSDENDPKKANPNFQFKGIVKNITSINSTYGIKTAGYWDLEMQNVKIFSSKNNGFFLSKDATNKKVSIRNLHIAHCKGNGLFLAAKSIFWGENITIDSCNAPLTIYETTTDIRGLKINNNLKNIVCITIEGEINQRVSIDSFAITGNNEDNTYLITTRNEASKFSNGFIKNNKSPYFLFVGEKVNTCELSNMTFENNSFYNILTPIGDKKTLKILNIRGVSSQKIIRKLDNRKLDKIIE